ncbi:hypothetical protein GCM10009785_30510 [Brooklawnia cerclae]|uniref:Uncharacterized protein n=1 Tax=Brooklawnia cerclae TaxID=349934 RepID=A0ABX0SE39_9ACTN|nr:hypothetical protein [Brooklawnia cerclae]NIH56658.1 hypothetical protein [Brooklawnia cerclae]
MSFQDLPPNWSDLPLDDPTHCANIVDLVVGERDRACNSLLLLPCTPQRVPLPTPMLVADMPWGEDPQPLFDMWAHMPDEFCSGLLLATSHPGIGQPARHRAWLHNAAAGFARLGIPVVGVFTAARDGVHAS